MFADTRGTSANKVVPQLPEALGRRRPIFSMVSIPFMANNRVDYPPVNVYIDALKKTICRSLSYSEAAKPQDFHIYLSLTV